eukprot:Gb_35555 [translate_table: standard]
MFTKLESFFLHKENFYESTIYLVPQGKANSALDSLQIKMGATWRKGACLIQMPGKNQEMFPMNQLIEGGRKFRSLIGSIMRIKIPCLRLTQTCYKTTFDIVGVKNLPNVSK